MNFGEVWEVRCEKWTCDVRCEKLSCDGFWCDKWGVRSGVRSGAVMSWDVISCDELWWEVVYCAVYCACHAKGSRGPSGDHARRSSSRRLCVLRLPRERQPRPQRRPRAPQLLILRPRRMRKAAAAPAATTRAAAPPGGSVYCACHARWWEVERWVMLDMSGDNGKWEVMGEMW